MFGHTILKLLPTSLLAVLTVLPAGSAWSPFGTRATEDKPLNEVLAGEKNLTTYYDLIKEYPDILLQLPSLDGVTLVAPTNEAFTKYGDWDPKNKSLVTSFLEYHTLQGTVSIEDVPVGVSTFAKTLLTDKSYTNVTDGQQMLINKSGDNVVVITSGLGSRSTVVKADVPFGGGLIHIVDTLMVPPARVERTTRDAYKDLQAFLGALYTADLLSEFADSTDVTIFAPRNAAFQLIAGTLEDLPEESLSNILKYHLIKGNVLSSTELKNGTNLTTEADGDVPLNVIRAGNNMYFNRAQLLQPDILIANGVIHIIDAVLNPEEAAATPDPVLGTQLPVFPVTGTKTATGAEDPVPFTTAFPCTENCDSTQTQSGDATVTEAPGGLASTGTATTGLTTTSSSGTAPPSKPNPTGIKVPIAAAAGVAIIIGGLAGGGDMLAQFPLP